MAYGLCNYLESLFEEFQNNRRDLDNKWRRNKQAYDGVVGNDITQSIGMGNKGNAEDLWRSKTVVNVTRTKVHAGEILVNDVVCAGNELPFLLKEYQYLPDGRKKEDAVVPDESTIPPEYQGMDVTQIFELEKQKALMQIGIAVENGELSEEEAAMAYQNTINAQLPPRPKTSAEQMKELIAEQIRRADGVSVLRKAVFSAAIYGEGVGKMYSKTYRRHGFVQDADTGLWNIQDTKEQGIGLKNVSLFNFFTDIENRNIQENMGIFERTYMSRNDIVAMYKEDDPNVVPDELKRLIGGEFGRNLEFGSNEYKDNDSPELRLINRRHRTIQVLEFWGRVPEYLVKEFENRKPGIVDSGLEFTKTASFQYDNGKMVEVTAVIAEGCLLKFQRTENAMRPYFRIDWEEPIDDIAPKSIADVIDTMQQSLNSAMRLFEDNKKLAANVMFGRKKRYFENKNDTGSLYPGKSFDIAESCDDVRKALQPIVVPDVSDRLVDAIAMYQRQANDQSMIPDIAHGIQADTKTTAYEISLQNEKAGKYISEIVKNVDRNAIEPIVYFFYQWNMLDPNVTNECKGSYDIHPLGFASYQDKASKLNKIMQIMNITMQSEPLMNMVNLKALLRDAISANDADPEAYLVDDPQMNNLQDIKFNQFAQQIGQQINAMGEQLQRVVQAVPQLLDKSDSATDLERARAEKLRMDAQRTAADIENSRSKSEDQRAKTIASIQERDRKYRLDDLKTQIELRKLAKVDGWNGEETRRNLEKIDNSKPPQQPPQAVQGTQETVEQ